MVNAGPISPDDIFDLPSKAEAAILYLSIGITLASIFPLAYAIWFRNFPPMKAQHVSTTVIIGIGGIIFNISNNLMEGMAGYDGALGLCGLWGVWGMFTFGLSVFLSAINMRLVLFYRVFITGNTTARSNSAIVNFSRRFWPFFALWLPSLVTGIVISALRGQQGAWLLEDYGLRVCTFSMGYLLWTNIYFIIMIVLSWVLYFRMRKVANAFNGFRMAIWTLVVSTLIMVVGMVVNYLEGSRYPWGRITIAVTNMVTINGYIWMIFGPPVIGHLFWREQTMRNYMNTLHKDSLIARQTRGGDMYKHAYVKSEIDLHENAHYDQAESFSYDIHNQEDKLAPSQFEFQSPMAVFSTDMRRML
ncbi:hypothetical protein BX661DRAFT_167858 [Kickxella alabastrina]|uniref:uncharacterized protein n=1 Tax=Kickxella alabastrina TaxID=61397 RepID=UPI00221EB8F7|nr:uncharacterized protein BX661DRAFT_167858 [Kickxella alabastrina]KAI7834624.1 hypothetical protein BX661DRAFT_167858 [Kickxella alabastrina]